MTVAPKNPIAIQLYTVREPASVDFAGTLRKLAKGGARAVEFAGYGGMAIPELQNLLRELDLRVAGAHISLPLWEERPEEVVAELATLGGDYAIVPWLAPERRPGEVQAARALAADLNRYAEIARAGGLGFAYHHHEFELAPLSDGGGDTLFDIIVNETDPNLVNLEVDVYWAAYAGVDPAKLLQELQGRAPLVHLKDMAAGPERGIAPAGEGILRWDEILPAASNARWWVIEQDFPTDPVAEALLGMKNMERLSG